MAASDLKGIDKDPKDQNILPLNYCKKSPTISNKNVFWSGTEKLMFTFSISFIVKSMLLLQWCSGANDSEASFSIDLFHKNGL